MSTVDGGPAFPTMLYEHGGELDGMTLRDYIAIQLMPEILSRMGLGLSRDAVRYAYEIADIMIEARSQ